MPDKHQIKGKKVLVFEVLPYECVSVNSAYWVISSFLKNSLRCAKHQSAKQFGSRSGLIFCLVSYDK